MRVIGRGSSLSLSRMLAFMASATLVRPAPRRSTLSSFTWIVLRAGGGTTGTIRRVDSGLSANEVHFGAQARPAVALPDGPAVMAAGRLSYQKHPEMLVDASAILLREFPKLRFVWIGDGELRTQVEERMQEHRTHALHSCSLLRCSRRKRRVRRISISPRTSITIISNTTVIHSAANLPGSSTLNPA